ncbi:MAG: hypothetical protein ACQESF_04710 [Nanobdellota archaeon]
MAKLKYADIKNIIIIMLVTAIICSSIIIFSYKDKNNNLREKISTIEKEALTAIANMNKTINFLDSQNSRLKASLKHLNSSYNTLKYNYKMLNKSYQQLGEEYKTQQTDVQRLLTSIELYKQEIERSMEWFQKNSNIKILDIKELEDDLEDKCLKKSSCKIKLGCLHLVNKGEDYSYKSDESTNDQKDKLQSLQDFINNKGGDCEDYSLFYKAELNFLAEKCNEEITFETYKEGANNYFLDYDKKLYVKNAKKVTFSGYTSPVIVCGKIEQLPEDKNKGHCAIALSKKIIKNRQDFTSLNKAPVIEPQNGKLIGIINKDIKLANTKSTEITLLITDNDLFLFSENENKWLSYKNFYNKLNTIKSKFSEQRDQ